MGCAFPRFFFIDANFVHGALVFSLTASQTPFQSLDGSILSFLKPPRHSKKITTTSTWTCYTGSSCGIIFVIVLVLAWVLVATFSYVMVLSKCECWKKQLHVKKIMNGWFIILLINSFCQSSILNKTYKVVAYNFMSL